MSSTYKIPNTFVIPAGVESRPIPVKEFSKTLEALGKCKENINGFWEEFYSIEEIVHTKREKLACELGENNTKKNRYRDILPYDHSIVKLKTLKNEIDDSTYINASYLDESYIGTQGPLPKTIEDFWRMVYEKNTKIIVMVADIKETSRGKPKCEVYWPTAVNCNVVYGDITITLQKEEKKNKGSFVVRTLELVKGDSETIIVYQCHMNEWPDHGVPGGTKVVLDFVIYCNTLQSELQKPKEEIGPVVVHCSAGVGRTGTFVLLSLCIKALKTPTEGNEYIDIVGLLIKLREKRMCTVQTMVQYEFIYKVMGEYLRRYEKDELEKPPQKRRRVSSSGSKKKKNELL